MVEITTSQLFLLLEVFSILIGIGLIISIILTNYTPESQQMDKDSKKTVMIFLPFIWWFLSLLLIIVSLIDVLMFIFSKSEEDQE